MMVTESFSLDTLNIIIGLHKGHRYFSKSFKTLAYQILRYEEKIKTPLGQVSPDCISYSQKTRHTLLCEWTAERNPDPRKLGQIKKCLSVERDELVNRLAVPAFAGEKNSTWLVIQPEAVANYQKALQGLDFSRLLISSVDSNEPPISLRYIQGNSSDKQLNNLLNQEIEIRQIPHYVEFCFDNLSSREFVDGFARTLVSFAVKQRYTFDSREIAAATIGDFWQYLNRGLQKTLRDKARDTLKEFRARKVSQNWLIRVGKDDKWELYKPVELPPSQFSKRVAKAVEKLLAEKYEENPQMQLFEID